MYYEIHVKGHLAPNWAAWFAPLAIENTGGDTAVLAGDLPDQTALYGVLMRLRDLGLPLLEVHQRPAVPDTTAAVPREQVPVSPQV
jgi:hypothetical protein